MCERELPFLVRGCARKGAFHVAEKLGLERTFYGQLKPISDRWNEKALAVSGFSREESLDFDEPEDVMVRFRDWLSGVADGQPRFISDNNGFDWQFVNWYFHHFLESNPFGFSSTNLGSLYKGVVRDTFKNFKHLRKTRHTHTIRSTTPKETPKRSSRSAISSI